MQEESSFIIQYGQADCYLRIGSFWTLRRKKATKLTAAEANRLVEKHHRAGLKASNAVAFAS
jgi:hypothetical protein